jgi:hypothetical protein
LPTGPWGRTWVVALLVAASLVGGYEGFWRLRGFRPTLTDDAGLWVAARARVRDDDPEQVVLVGDSRMQLGLDPAAYGAGGPEPVMLAIDGQTPYTILGDLAANTRFRGTVLVDVSPTSFGRDDVTTPAEVPAEFLSTFRHRSAIDGLEQALRSVVQRSLVLRLPDIGPRALVASARTGFPKPGYLDVRPNRFKAADYTKADVAALVRTRVEATRLLSPLPAAEMGRRAEQVHNLIAPILARGGRVVFIFFPISGEAGRIERQLMPRRDYFDVLATKTTAIHFEDVPSLRDFTCPDGSHLDYRDAGEFSRRLAVVVRELPVTSATTLQ